MPTDTFFNLPPDKRKRILDAATDEFSTYTFDEASIARIVKGAGIPRGSFYQYFEDKKDLFKYILQLAGEEKYKAMMPVLSKMNELGFFEGLREVYKAGMQYVMEHPKYAKIGELFLSHPNQALKKEILGERDPQSVLFFKQLLEKGIENGEIDSDIDLDMTALTLMAVSTASLEYFINHYKLHDMNEFLNIVDQMLYVIQNGIKSKKRRDLS